MKENHTVSKEIPPPVTGVTVKSAGSRAIENFLRHTVS